MFNNKTVIKAFAAALILISGTATASLLVLEKAEQYRVKEE